MVIGRGNATITRPCINRAAAAGVASAVNKGVFLFLSFHGWGKTKFLKVVNNPRVCAIALKLSPILLMM